MDLGSISVFVTFNKFMKLIRRLNGENFYLSSQIFQIYWLISGMEVLKNGVSTEIV